MKTTISLLLLACACVGQEYVPRVMPLKGYTVYRRNDAVNGTVQTTKWTATPDYCIERICSMKTWNKPTNAYVIPVSGSVKVTERWYYKDQVTKLFCSFTNIDITFSSGVWVTNYIATWPMRIAEPPISFHGSVFFAGTNGISETREGDVVYRVDNSRNTTNMFWVMFNFRVAPAGEDIYLKYYMQASAGSVTAWYPSFSKANAKVQGIRWMQKVGYAQLRTYPYGQSGNVIIEDGPHNQSNQIPLN